MDEKIALIIIGALGDYIDTLKQRKKELTAENQYLEHEIDEYRRVNESLGNALREAEQIIERNQWREGTK